jgi:hypothetical protein
MVARPQGISPAVRDSTARLPEIMVDDKRDARDLVVVLIMALIIALIIAAAEAMAILLLLG